MKRQKCETRAGQGSHHTLTCSLASSKLTSARGYRALDHIFTIYISSVVGRHFTLSRIFNRLPPHRKGSFSSCASVPSTHDLEDCYRPSTHIFTALRPMFLGSSLSYLPLLRIVSRRFVSQLAYNQEDLTALPPTFLPCFHTPVYRASNHHLPALPPTKFSPFTALSPIKIAANFLNTFSVQTCKVVSKFDLKNTTSLMMSFFLFFVWSQRL